MGSTELSSYLACSLHPGYRLFCKASLNPFCLGDLPMVSASENQHDHHDATRQWRSVNPSWEFLWKTQCAATFSYHTDNNLHVTEGWHHSNWSAKSMPSHKKWYTFGQDPAILAALFANVLSWVVHTFFPSLLPWLIESCDKEEMVGKNSRFLMLI